ncbi:reverse transcriptase [Lasius niger]|uniref:Reverse transcriptase n=1 Tax=Lasius niger TaxID=67767 RepID=A0A0J7KDX3_LASNI|nr:reverse transcriptase [Lasius niger]
MESLSDHVCICFDVCTGRSRPPPTRAIDRRWNLRKFDRDFFKATLIWGGRDPEADDAQDLNQTLKELDKLMEEACDAAAPRIGPCKPRRKAYWWQESVANLRISCIRARRLWQRAKRRIRSSFGFRRNRSTCDALLTVKRITSTAVKNGGLAFVVSLDISNAFNSIPWRVIRRALRRKAYPPYIRRILDSYFANRIIRYLDKDGRRNTRNKEAGVPQGSVLGLVLWNIAFDEVLDLADGDERSHIFCYADDTLIVVTERDLRTTQLRAGLLVARAIISIQKLGLKVAKEKTEAILFHERGAVGLPASIMVENTSVKFSSSIKYLGVYIDVNWLFYDHFLH